MAVPCKPCTPAPRFFLSRRCAQCHVAEAGGGHKQVRLRAGAQPGSLPALREFGGSQDHGACNWPLSPAGGVINHS